MEVKSKLSFIFLFFVYLRKVREVGKKGEEVEKVYFHAFFCLRRPKVELRVIEATIFGN